MMCRNCCNMVLLTLIQESGRVEIDSAICPTNLSVATHVIFSQSFQIVINKNSSLVETIL